MKILVVTPKYFPDAFSINIIVDELVSRGHEVDVLTSIPFDKNGYLPQYESQNVEIKDNLKINRLKVAIRGNRRNSVIKNYLSFYRLSKKWIRKTKEIYDVVFTFEVSPVLSLAAGNIYKKKHHVRHVGYVLDLWPESIVIAGYTQKSSLLYRLMKIYSKKLYSKLDHILVSSPSFKTYLENNFGINGSKISYLPQTGLIYENKFDNNPYDSSRFNILYCGNISSWQNLKFIIDVCKENIDKKVCFNLVGQGAYKEKMIEESKKYHLEDKINFVDQVSAEVADSYYKHADAIFVGLDNTTFAGNTIPNKLISALYYGKPIIGMIGGDGGELLQKAQGDFVIEQNKDALLNAVIRLMNLNKESRNILGKKNAQFYLDNFSKNKVADVLLSTLSSK